MFYIGSFSLEYVFPLKLLCSILLFAFYWVGQSRRNTRFADLYWCYWIIPGKHKTQVRITRLLRLPIGTPTSYNGKQKENRLAAAQIYGLGIVSAGNALSKLEMRRIVADLQDACYKFALMIIGARN